MRLVLLWTLRFDSDIGAVRMGRRFYDSGGKRFLRGDTYILENFEKCLDFLTTCNLYSYGRNNPMSFIDPTGDTEKDVNLAYDMASKDLGNLPDSSEVNISFEKPPSGSSAAYEPSTDRLIIDPKYKEVLQPRQMEALLRSVHHEATHQSDARRVGKMTGNSFAAFFKKGVLKIKTELTERHTQIHLNSQSFAEKNVRSFRQNSESKVILDARKKYPGLKVSP